ncbi:unnamed protein product [Arctogadus glacialis]
MFFRSRQKVRHHFWWSQVLYWVQLGKIPQWTGPQKKISEFQPEQIVCLRDDGLTSEMIGGHSGSMPNDNDSDDDLDPNTAVDNSRSPNCCGGGSGERCEWAFREAKDSREEDLSSNLTSEYRGIDKVSETKESGDEALSSMSKESVCGEMEPPPLFSLLGDTGLPNGIRLETIGVKGLSPVSAALSPDACELLIKDGPWGTVHTSLPSH